MSTIGITNQQKLGSLHAVAIVDVLGAAVVGVQITGTWVGTLHFQASNDGVNFFDIQAFPTSGGAAVSTTTGNGSCIVPVAGYAQYQTYAALYSSGTATVTTASSLGSQNMQLLTGTINVGTAAQGAAAALVGAWPVEITDGTNGPVAVKPASTPAALTDPAMVVAASPTCPLTKGNARNLAATPVAIKVSAGNLFALQICNSQNAIAFIQIFDAATGSVTPGTTSPDLELSIPASVTQTFSFPNGIPFATAITIISTTGEKGASGSSNGVMAFWQYA